jgi:NADH:ubiquinone oxidoreductase subunit D
MTLQRTTQKPITSRPFTINMGPFHPSCYGVVRLILSMSGEQIVSTDTHMYRRTVTTQALTKSKHYIEPIHSDDYGLLSYSFITRRARSMETGVTSLGKLLGKLQLPATRNINHF